MTPLHIASVKGFIRVATLLLKKGANVNSQSDSKYTPLHCASYHGHLEVAELLLQKGANVNTQNSSKETPLHLATFCGKKEIAKLLLQFECDLELKEKDGKTAENIASSKGFYDIVRLILQKKLGLLDQEAGAPSTGSSENSDDCTICYEPKNGTFAFIPCGHTIACERCCILKDCGKSLSSLSK